LNLGSLNNERFNEIVDVELKDIIFWDANQRALANLRRISENYPIKTTLFGGDQVEKNLSFFPSDFP